MKKQLAALVLLNMLFLSGGCAATKLPVVDSMTPTPTPKATLTPTATPTPTETPIAIITNSPQESSTPIPVSLTPIAEAEDHLKTLGYKQEGENVIRVKLVNATGFPITGFRIISKAAYEYDEYTRGTRLLEEGDTFADKEERILYYDTSEDDPNDTGAKEYYIKLTFQDETVRFITQFPYKDMKEGVIYYEGEIPYLVYLSAASSGQVSLRDAETAGQGSLAAQTADEEEEYEDYEEDYDREYEDNGEDYDGSYEDGDHSEDYEEDYDAYDGGDYEDNYNGDTDYYDDYEGEE